MTTWRRLPFDRGPTPAHFALSDALVRLAPGSSLWWHAASTPALILGAAQTPADINLQRARAGGITVVKRHAGGTSVLALPDVLGLDVVLTRGEPLAAGDVVESYRWLGETWQAALQILGVESRVLSIAEARAHPTQGPYAGLVQLACFGSLSPYEVVVAPRRKLVGLAQVRRAGNALFQAGIHTRFDASALSELLTDRDSESVSLALSSAAVGLDEVLAPPPDLPSVMSAFEHALARLWGLKLEDGDWTSRELEHAETVRASITLQEPDGMEPV